MNVLRSSAAWVGAALVALTAAGVRGGGVVDVEVVNRTRVLGSLATPLERETVRTLVPAGVRARVSVRSTKGGPGLVATASSAAGAADAVDRTVRRRKGASFPAPVPAADGFLRLDVGSDQVHLGDYEARIAWSAPRRRSRRAAVDAEPLRLPFAAERATTARARIRTKGGPRGAARIEGPGGFVADLGTSAVSPPAVGLPETGTYALVVEGGDAPATVSASVLLGGGGRPAKVDLRDRSGARYVARAVGEGGGDVVVDPLDGDVIAEIDVPGAGVAFPAGSLGAGATVGVGAGAAFRDPAGDGALAGVPVEYGLVSGDLTGDATVTVPFDAGAFDGEDPVVLTQAADGSVSTVGAEVVVDAETGTATFPTSHFSSYAVFGPRFELADVPAALAVAVVARGADGTLYVATPFRIYRFDPADGSFTLFAGGGASRTDGTDRLAYSFLPIQQVGAARDGGLLVVETPFVGASFGPPDVVRIAADGTVRRVAGDGTGTVAVGVPATATGLPTIGAVAEDPAGDVYLGTSTVLFTQDGHGLDGILRVGGGTGLLDVVAGGGTLEDPAGGDPRSVSMIGVGALTTDAAGRLVAGDALGVFRFDFGAGTAERIAGVTALELIRRAGFDSAAFFAELDREPNGLGSSLRNVRFELIQGLAFDTARPDFLYVSDYRAGLLWRLDLRRGRAYVVAGRYRLSGAPDPGAGPLDPTDVEITGPTTVAVDGRSVFVVELGAASLRVLRPVAQ